MTAPSGESDKLQDDLLELHEKYKLLKASQAKLQNQLRERVAPLLASQSECSSPGDDVSTGPSLSSCVQSSCVRAPSPPIPKASSEVHGDGDSVCSGQRSASEVAASLKLRLSALKLQLKGSKSSSPSSLSTRPESPQEPLDSYRNSVDFQAISGNPGTPTMSRVDAKSGERSNLSPRAMSTLSTVRRHLVEMREKLQHDDGLEIAYKPKENGGSDMEWASQVGANTTAGSIIPFNPDFSKFMRRSKEAVARAEAMFIEHENMVRTQEAQDSGQEAKQRQIDRLSKQGEDNAKSPWTTPRELTSPRAELDGLKIVQVACNEFNNSWETGVSCRDRAMISIGQKLGSMQEEQNALREAKEKAVRSEEHVKSMLVEHAEIVVRQLQELRNSECRSMIEENNRPGSPPKQSRKALPGPTDNWSRYYQYWCEEEVADIQHPPSKNTVLDTQNARFPELWKRLDQLHSQYGTRSLSGHGCESVQATSSSPIAVQFEKSSGGTGSSLCSPTAGELERIAREGRCGKNLNAFTQNSSPTAAQRQSRASPAMTSRQQRPHANPNMPVYPQSPPYVRPRAPSPTPVDVGVGLHDDMHTLQSKVEDTRTLIVEEAGIVTQVQVNSPLQRGLTFQREGCMERTTESVGTRTEPSGSYAAGYREDSPTNLRAGVAFSGVHEIFEASRSDLQGKIATVSLEDEVACLAASSTDGPQCIIDQSRGRSPLRNLRSITPRGHSSSRWKAGTSIAMDLQPIAQNGMQAFISAPDSTSDCVSSAVTERLRSSATAALTSWNAQVMPGIQHQRLPSRQVSSNLGSRSTPSSPVVLHAYREMLAAAPTANQSSQQARCLSLPVSPTSAARSPRVMAPRIHLSPGSGSRQCLASNVTTYINSSYTPTLSRDTSQQSPTVWAALPVPTSRQSSFEVQMLYGSPGEASFA